MLLRLRSLIDRRVRPIPPWVLLTQLFFGLGWLRAAAEKVIDPAWWDGTVVREFLATHEELTLGWYAPFADGIVVPLAGLVAVVVVVAQLVAGSCLLTGRLIGLGATVGILLNLNFVAAGAVNPSAFYLLSQGALLLWLVEQNPYRKRKLRLLGTGVIVVGALGVMSLPFVGTVHPAEVVDDPASMLALLGALGVAMADSTSRRVTGRGLP